MEKDDAIIIYSSIIFFYICLLWITIFNINDLQNKDDNMYKEIHAIKEEVALSRTHKHNYGTGLPDYNPRW